MPEPHEPLPLPELAAPDDMPLSAQEQWDETLDALAVAVARDVASRGLLRKGAAKALRFHFRGYARRLLVPVLDEAQRELRNGFETATRLMEENERLRAGLRGMRDARRQEVRAAAIGAPLLASAVTAILVLTLL
jgi:hypothetical protein